ncbi:uncharacterized protein ACWYII_012136 isoform 1-T1 [Salvelinus alpinus]
MSGSIYLEESVFLSSSIESSLAYQKLRLIPFQEQKTVPGLKLSSLCLLAPPLRLMSAFGWQVARQHIVKHYGKLEEFVTLATEMVPELLSSRQRTQLLLGLRARVMMMSWRLQSNFVELVQTLLEDPSERRCSQYIMALSMTQHCRYWCGSSSPDWRSCYLYQTSDRLFILLHCRYHPVPLSNNKSCHWLGAGQL